MMPKQVVLEFPVDLPEEGLHDKEAIKKGKEGMILELLRKEEISQGKAAELLGISRNEILDLMTRYDIPMANFSPEEPQRQRKEAMHENEVQFLMFDKQTQQPLYLSVE